jgi:APA family basic amino acid/polyamine antiporter
MKRESIARLEKKSLKRVLKVGDLFAIGFGDVGSSIYYALGATALFALGATPLALAIAGAVFICTALTYAELSSTFPEPGGSATFSRYAFNDLVSFIAGWGLLLDYVVTMSISAFAIPPYLRHVFMNLGLPTWESVGAQLLFTVLILIALFLVNVVGVRYSGRFSFFFAVVTAFTQFVVIVFGFVLVANFPYVFSIMKIGAAHPLSPSFSEFLKGVAMAMVAYTGIEAITQLAGETLRPSFSIPRAIKLTVGLLVFIYFGIAVVGMSVISPQELGTTYINDPIAGIVASFPKGGGFLAPFVGIAAAFILLIASNAGLLGCSRLVFALGEHYQVPAFFFRTHKRYRTPCYALAAFTAIGCIVVLASRGQMLFLADLYNIGAQIAFFSANLSLIVLRWRRPDLQRPYRAPFNIPIGRGRSVPLTALLGGLANLLVFGVVVVTKPEGRYAAMIWMVVGLVTFFLYRRKKALSPLCQLTVERVKIPDYSPMHVKNILVAARTKDNTEALQTACQLARLHKAKLTAVHVIEVPFSVPIDVPMDKREEIGENALKRAEAVANEYHVNIDLQLVRSRSIEAAFSSLVENQHFDLVVIGVSSREAGKEESFGEKAKKILEEAPCRVLMLQYNR